MLSDPGLPTPEPGNISLPSLASGSSSLAQAARLKQLNIARAVLFILGILTVAISLYLFYQTEEVRGELDKQINELARQDNDIDWQELEKLRDAEVRAHQVSAAVVMGIGVIYLILGTLVKKFPVPVTVIGLVLYISLQVIGGIADPESIWQGILLKVLIIVALAKAVQAAIAYQKASDAEAMADFAG